MNEVKRLFFNVGGFFVVLTWQDSVLLQNSLCLVTQLDYDRMLRYIQYSEILSACWKYGKDRFRRVL